MTALVMQCTKVESHPNADALRVYNFKYNDLTLQIVANMENVYEVGDCAVIAQVGATLLDGMKIKPANIRGVDSYGMALGKTDLPNGTYVTEQYCLSQDEADQKVDFISWPDIGSLFNVRKYLVHNNLAQKVTYRGKVKLHGSNACVVLLPSNSKASKKILAQSRSKFITVNDDNVGFAKFVEDHQETFESIRKNADNLGVTDRLSIFGEWCGPGINKGCAIHNIDKKIFAIFAVQIGEDDAKIETDPEKISNMLGIQNDDIFILPWFEDTIELSFENPLLLEEKAKLINEKVLEVENCDPWVKETFGVSGIGEGLVMYPLINGETLVSREDYKLFVFKAKGEKHQVVKTKQPVQINPEVASSIDEFVELMVTENRLEQIAQKVGGFDKKNMGLFMKEFGQDVQKESTAELEDSKLEWKQVAKQVGAKARSWFIYKCEEI